MAGAHLVGHRPCAVLGGVPGVPGICRVDGSSACTCACALLTACSSGSSGWLGAGGRPVGCPARLGHPLWNPLCFLPAALVDVRLGPVVKIDALVTEVHVERAALEARAQGSGFLLVGVGVIFQAGAWGGAESEHVPCCSGLVRRVGGVTWLVLRGGGAG